jgi:UDP-N-acetylmuramate: L-alanyl-gamma-D-glutamyl-meso-diaminopimelate ligase
MQVHILGICGTFMGGLAVLGNQLGFTVTGSDVNVYPPMSTQLESLGILLTQGYQAEQLSTAPDCVVVGNVMKRGIPVIEALLDQGLPFLSGPEWLSRYVLSDRHVLAVSGTHGKTTTSSMLAWILEHAGLDPGFLIGGIPHNFGESARLGTGKYFVVEADEYDSAFFDKRSKFIHYHPRTLIINNIEFDHADIFPNLAAIQLQFHHLIRTLPASGLLICPDNDPVIDATLQMGCWTSKMRFNSQNGWVANNKTPDGSAFDVVFNQTSYGRVKWSLLGQHNISNALAAMAAARHIGVSASMSVEALCLFKGVKRRLEIKGREEGITVYDDFAHHPTAINTTLAGLRAHIGAKEPLIAVLDIRSNTMRAGHHHELLASSLSDANAVFLFKSNDIHWNVEAVWASTDKPGGVFFGIKDLLAALGAAVTRNTHVVFMSNGGFAGVHHDFLSYLKNMNAEDGTTLPL